MRSINEKVEVLNLISKGEKSTKAIRYFEIEEEKESTFT